MLRARQRDVGEPQVLPALLDEELPPVVAVAVALEPDVDPAGVAGRGVVVGDRPALRG